ncbi:YchE family NAAT transporter [soil metagenome]
MDIPGFIKLFIALLAIVNPLGAVPVFLAATATNQRVLRPRIALKASLTVFITLLVSAWVGKMLLSFFGIGIPAFRVGGGILILLMAISMMDARMPGAKVLPEEEREALDYEEIGVVPLGIPLLSGPGSIALVIVTADRGPQMGPMLMLSGAILIVAVASYAILSLGALIGHRLGKTGINLSTRLSGLLLAAVAIEFISAGAVELFPGLR